MPRKRCVLGFLFLMCFSLSGYSAHAEGTESIPVGTILPFFKLEASTAKADQEYLGLTDSDLFTLSQVSGKLVILDIVSAL